MKNTIYFYFKLLCTFTILSSILFSPIKSFAVVDFEDYFNTTSFAESWIENVVVGSGTGLWFIQDGALVSDVKPGVSSQLYVKNSFNKCNYVIESNAMALDGLDMSFIFRISADYSSYYSVDFRFHDPDYTSEPGNNYRLWKYTSKSNFHNVNDYKKLLETTPSQVGSNNLVLGEIVNVKIIADGNNIKVYHDDVLIFDYTDTSDSVFYCGGYGLRSWGGNYLSVNRFLDYKVSSLDPIPQEKNKKYILIPGLGASWNTLAMVYDEEVENSDWSMTPFVTNYENISSYFDSKNLDYDVWNYDWRRPLLEIVSDFEEYIDENIEENDEVYVVGHSLGGLVARMWYQKNSNDDRIGKVISVGSPHKGAVKAYEAYNGGKLIEGYDFGFTVWNLYLTLINKGGSTMIDTIREKVPILRDISPTYEFLSKNNVLFPKEQSKYFNSILSDWNENYNNWDKVWPITGIGEETKYKINLKNRSIFDQVLNLWPDGKPDSYENGDGDGTVLVESAGFEKENRIEVAGGHADLVSTFLNRILDILEVEESDLSDASGVFDGRIFYLGSPAEMRVKCEGIDEKLDNNGFVFVSRDENDSNCQIKILGTGEGVYHLVMADTTLNNWQYYENKIENGEELILDVDNQANIIKTEKSEDYLYGLILNDIKLLEETGVRDDYKNVKKAVVKKDVEYVIDWSLRFRKKHKEELLTKRIVENCLKIGPNHKIYAKMIWQKNYLKVSDNFLKTAERLSVLKRLRGREVNSFEANNYFWMENLVYRIKNSSNDGDRFLLYRVLVKVFTMF